MVSIFQRPKSQPNSLPKAQPNYPPGSYSEHYKWVGSFYDIQGIGTESD